ncbi:MAG: hypothetical protein ACLRSD_05710 [Oscillibacter sp.]
MSTSTFFFALIFGGIGFLDDFEKVAKHKNLGLTAIQKFLLQLSRRGGRVPLPDAL